MFRHKQHKIKPRRAKELLKTQQKKTFSKIFKKYKEFTIQAGGL